MNEPLWMNDRLIPTSSPEARVVAFAVAGCSLTRLARQLKPALTKAIKKQAESVCAVISTTPSRVTFGVPGAAVGMPAITTGTSTAEMPLSLLTSWLGEKFEDGAIVTFEIAPGSIRIGNITTTSPQIVVQPAASAPPSSGDLPSQPQPVAADPLDAAIDAPLVAAYAYLKKYGRNLTTASKVFAAQQVEVEELLVRADRLLRPLGLGRRDVEAILDQRLKDHV